MKKMLLLLNVFLLAACSGQKHWNTILDAAENIMDERPDSALVILDSLDQNSDSFSRRTKMRWQLLLTTAQNKCDTVFHSDSLQLVLTDYYDRHGTPNERMMAHYLLGRAYSDMGEAPSALQCYLNAAECADTTDSECDLRQLSIVNMQTGRLFALQYLPDYAISFYDKSAKWALEAGDTMLYINATEQKIYPLYELSDGHNLDSITTLVHREYVKRGLLEKAARATGSSILYHINNNHKEKARQLLDFIDNNVDSDLLENDDSWLIYKAYHGKTHLAYGEIDAAEKAFRALLPYDSILSFKVMAYCGLMDVYGIRGIPDSVYKYTRAYCLANDSSNIFRYSREMEKMMNMYNYDRMRIKAVMSQRQSDKKSFIILLVVTCAIAASVISFIMAKKRQEASKLKMLVQIEKYNSLKESYIAIHHDVEALKDNEKNLNDILKAKEQALADKEQRIREYDAQLNTTQIDKGAATSDEVEDLHKTAMKGTKADNSTLRDLRKLLKANDPEFLSMIKDEKHNISFRQENICILMRLGFSASEVAVLLGMSPQALSNSKKRLLHRLFNIDGKASDLNDYISAF